MYGHGIHPTIAEMLSEDRGPELVPTVYGWFVAPTYKMASQIWREFQSYFPREWVVDYWKSDYQIATINGGIIEVRSADDPDTLVGVGLDIVQITEAARIRNLEEVWANLETRLCLLVVGQVARCIALIIALLEAHIHSSIVCSGGAKR